jgi:hypothetical protein
VSFPGGDEAPAGFTYRQRVDIHFTDYQPVGFVAQYGGESGDVKVVFLVLDMDQYPQKEAAKTAAISRFRKKEPQ